MPDKILHLLLRLRLRLRLLYYVFIVVLLFAFTSGCETGGPGDRGSDKKESVDHDSNGSNGNGISGIGGNNTEPAKADTDRLILLADGGWESIRFQNNVAKIILEKGYGYNVDMLAASSSALKESLRTGVISVYMEYWEDERYRKDTESGEITTLSANFVGADEGIYIPYYLTEVEDELKSIEDLTGMADLFDGQIFTYVEGSNTTETVMDILRGYGLNSCYDFVVSANEDALINSLDEAYSAGKPWVGYLYAPWGIVAKYDMVALKSSPGEFEPRNVYVVINTELKEEAPNLVSFLSNYSLSSELISEILYYLTETEMTASEGAKWFLLEHQDIWTGWVSDDAAQRVKKSLDIDVDI